MTSEWIKTTIGEFASLQRGHDLPEQNRQFGSVPILGSFGITGHHNTAKAKGPGVTIGRSGASYGTVSYSAVDYWPLNTALYVTDFHGNNEKFVYYFFRAFDFSALNSGSAQPSLNRNFVHPIEIKIPQRREQDEIATILSTLDDKIELNRRMNATLEQIAQALFKSWFVDFDPVKAKAEGRAPEGMDEETAALFPSEFEESEMGLIPKGWQVQQIKGLASSIQYGLTQSAKSEPVGPRFLRITDIQGGKVHWEPVPYCYASDEEIARYQIGEGDILVARTGASTGENIYIVNPPFAVFASYLVRFRFSDLHIARLVAAFMRSESYFDYVKGCIGGSAQPNANAHILSGAYLVFPGDEIAKRFYDALRPMDIRCVANREESQTLAQLRDALLPRLITGQLRIDEGRTADAML